MSSYIIALWWLHYMTVSGEYYQTHRVQLPLKLKRLVHFEHSVIPILKHWEEIKKKLYIGKTLSAVTVHVRFWEQNGLNI